MNRQTFFDHLIDFFTSLRLTVVCLALGMVLILLGTLAQVDLGLYKAQHEFFRSFVAFWTPPGLPFRIPLPGGYLVGGVLLINLVASHFRRFTLTWDKAGIWLVHFGLILLLVGQLMTDFLSRETVLHLREGEAKNYSESNREVELAVVDTTDPAVDKVVAIPQGVLMSQKEVRLPELPFALRVNSFFANSSVTERPADATQPPPATQGAGRQALLQELPRVTVMEQRDVPSAVIEPVTSQGSLGTWLVSEYVSQPQSITANNRTYRIEMRLRRFYKPFSLKLLEFHHDLYPGTSIPKNYSSRVLLERPSTGEKREVDIYMNNPLRYAGETFYQSSFDEDDHGTVLQVVHNPSWLTPYFSCLLVGAGLIWQFLTHLLGFALVKKKPAPKAGAAPVNAALSLKETKA